MKTLIRVFIFLLLALPVAAEDVYQFKLLDARNGLTSSQINCILKDSRGFVWFGTPAGLYRYDGYIFKHFQSDSQDGSSLPDSYIISIQEANEGVLWIETAAGYCIYHPQTETFERDMRQAFANMGITIIPQIVYIDRHRNLWCYIPSHGVTCYNMQQQMIYDFSFNNTMNGAHSIPSGEICSIGECKDGAVIVYNNGMMVCCDVIHQQNVVWMTNDIAQKQIRKTNTLRMFADQMDNIWLYGQGTLFAYNKKTKIWNTEIGNQLGLVGLSTEPPRADQGEREHTRAGVCKHLDHDSQPTAELTKHTERLHRRHRPAMGGYGQIGHCLLGYQHL